MTPSRRHRSATRILHYGAPLAMAVAILGGCSLGGSDTFEVIPPQEIPFGLDQAATTTTTTTTTVPAPPPPDAGTTTTSAPPIQTEPVEVYFVSGLDRLQRQTIQLSSPVGPFQVLAVLEEEPAGEQSAGLRTAVPPDLVVDLSIERGVAAVDLDGAVLNALSSRDQRLAIAQIVLSTIGSIRGVGQVSFTIDGIPAEIGIPPDYTLSEPGQPLAFADFAALLVTGGPGGATSTTPTSTMPAPTSTNPANGSANSTTASTSIAETSADDQ